MTLLSNNQIKKIMTLIKEPTLNDANGHQHANSNSNGGSGGTSSSGDAQAHKEQHCWKEKAVKSLLKRIRKSNQLDEFERAVEQESAHTRCILLPRSQDGRLEVAKRKGQPHVFYCQLWRWPHLSAQHELYPVEHCAHTYNAKKRHICVNPYHYCLALPLKPILIPKSGHHQTQQATQQHTHTQQQHAHSHSSQSNLMDVDGDDHVVANMTDANQHHHQQQQQMMMAVAQQQQQQQCHFVGVAGGGCISSNPASDAAELAAPLIAVETLQDKTPPCVTYRPQQPPPPFSLPGLARAASGSASVCAAGSGGAASPSSCSLSSASFSLAAAAAAAPPATNQNLNQLSGASAGGSTRGGEAAAASALSGDAMSSSSSSSSCSAIAAANQCSASGASYAGSEASSTAAIGSSGSGISDCTTLAAAASSSSTCSTYTNNNSSHNNNNNEFYTPQTHFTDISSEMMNPADMLSNAEDEEDENDITNIDVDSVDLNNFTAVMYEEPGNWASIYYYEMKDRLGEPFKCQGSSVTVDGYTNPPTDCITDRFCLGHISNVNRKHHIESTRSSIGHGACFYYVDGRVFAENMSNSSIFIQSRNCNMSHKYDPATVIKVPSRCHLQIFDNYYFAKLLADNVSKGYDQVYAMTKMCCIRISFVKGWGADYQRQAITCTPCWIEIHLHGPLTWLDRVLNQMVSPSRPCTSYS